MTENLPARRDTPVKVNLSEPLTDLDQAWRLSDALSKSELVPESLRGKPASVLHVLLTGQAMDLHWSESIRVIYSPGKGQIGLRGQFLLSRLRKAGHTYTFEDGDGWATFILHRKDGETFKATFTRADAETAKLTSRTNWAQYEKRMLRWRAVAECVSFGAPEVSLGFEIEGAEEAPEPVQLQPTSPAPPEPASEAAPGPQAAQAEQLRELDEKMRGGGAGGNEDLEVETVTVQSTVVGEAEPSDMGGNFADEPVADTLAREAEEAEAVAEAEAVPEPAPETASSKAKTVVLAEHFTALGADPKQYRPYVLHACSVFAGRRIAGVRDLTAQEVMQLSNALSLLRRTFGEEGGPAALADQIELWRTRWEDTDPATYKEYEAPGDA